MNDTNQIKKSALFLIPCLLAVFLGFASGIMIIFILGLIATVVMVISLVASIKNVKDKSDSMGTTPEKKE